MANPGPGGHFWPARALRMAPHDFLSDPDRKIETYSKLPIKVLKLLDFWPALSFKKLAPLDFLIKILAHLRKRLAIVTFDKVLFT